MVNVRTPFATLVFVGVLLAMPTAAAHATFVTSQPAQGARLAAAPSEVAVTLSQDVDAAGSAIRVLDANSGRVDDDDLRVEGGERPVLRVTLRPGVGEGAYRVEWKALSRVDHHTTQGSFGFAVGNFTPPASTGDDGANSPSVPSILGRSLFFVGLFLAVASVVFGLWVSRGDRAGWLSDVERFAWPLLVAGCAILLGDAAGRTELPLAEWAGSVVLQDLLIRLVAAIAVALGAYLVRPASRARPAILGAAAVVLAYLSARSGHASARGILPMVVDTVHLLATASWVGGLLLFGYLLLSSRGAARSVDLDAVGRRFSALALTSLIVMAISGVLLGVVILGWPDLREPFAWFRGTYGFALLGKIVLAVAMVVLAIVNRFVFLGRLVPKADFMPRVRRRFGRFVAGEAGIGVVVLLLAAVLTSSSPPYAGPADTMVRVEGGSAKFHITMRIDSSPSAGAFSELQFQIVSLADGSTVGNNTCGRERGCIVVEVVQPGADERDEDEEDVHRGGEHRALEPRGDGWWSVPDVLFVDEGEYHFLVEIQTEYVYFDVVELNLLIGNPDATDEHAQHTGPATT